MKKTIKFLMLLCTTLVLNAGDPGAFEIDFYDAGVPSWLDRNKVLNGLKSQETWLGVTSRSKAEGRYVSRIFDNSPAQKVGIKVGDIIENNWNSIFKGKEPNDRIVLNILRDNKHITKEIKLGARDPLVYMLTSIEGDGHHSGDNHRKIHELTLKNKKDIYKRVFLKNKAFDCKNAHKNMSIKMLPSSKFRGRGVHVIVIRGSYRVMFINMGMSYENIGKKTICVNSTDYDGKNLTKEKVSKLYWKLFDDQIEYWYDNP